MRNHIIDDKNKTTIDDIKAIFITHKKAARAIVEYLITNIDKIPLDSDIPFEKAPPTLKALLNRFASFWPVCDFYGYFVVNMYEHKECGICGRSKHCGLQRGLYKKLQETENKKEYLETLLKECKEWAADIALNRELLAIVKENINTESPIRYAFITELIAKVKREAV